MLARIRSWSCRSCRCTELTLSVRYWVDLTKVRGVTRVLGFWVSRVKCALWRKQLDSLQELHGLYMYILLRILWPCHSSLPMAVTWLTAVIWLHSSRYAGTTLRNLERRVYFMYFTICVCIYETSVRKVLIIRGRSGKAAMRYRACWMDLKSLFQ